MSAAPEPRRDDDTPSIDRSDIDPNQPDLLWRVGRAVTRLFLVLTFEPKAYGQRNVPRTGGVLLVSNHQSYLDPALLGATWSGRFSRRTSVFPCG